MRGTGIPEPPLNGEVALPQAGSEGFHDIDAKL